MAKGRPTGVDTPGGSETVVNAGGSGGAAICATCCLNRSGQAEISDSYARIFTHFGHGLGGSAQVAAWHPYYYRGTYAFAMTWRQASSSDGGAANGTIVVTLRVNLVPRSMPPAVAAAIQRLDYGVDYRAATSDEINRSHESWERDIRARWSNRFTVILRGTDCPGDLPIEFRFERDSRRPHQEVGLYRMSRPRGGRIPAEAFSNPTHPQYGTAQQLRHDYSAVHLEHGSNAAKMNLDDSRGALVASHEYGHWIGWGDEYEGPLRGQESRFPGSRVAIRFKNPTKVYRDANGTDVESVSIMSNDVRRGLMAEMGSNGSGSNATYFKRYVYTVVHDFIARYNRTHHGGRSVAYCHDVRVNGGR